MFIAELLQVLRRRWYLVLAGLLCTLAAGAFTYQAVPPTFTASAEVLLLPPGPSVPAGGNPYLSLSGLTPAGDVLARALSDPKVAAEVAREGGLAGYTVELDGDSPAPLVFVSTEAGSAREALTTLDLVLARLPGTLRQIQTAANVPAKAFITTSQVTRTSAPEKSLKPQIRALVVVVGGCLVLTLLLVAAIDALLRRPRRTAESSQRHRRQPAPAEPKGRDAGTTNAVLGDRRPARQPSPQKASRGADASTQPVPAHRRAP